MKKTKKWKLITISLISIMGFATFATILTSCASSSFENNSSVVQSSNTTFNQTLNASSDVKLSKLIPSEFNLDLNKQLLLEFIFNKGVNGKKDNIKQSDLTIQSLSPDDVNGSLNLTYNIKNYWQNDTFIENVKTLNLSITGLLKGSSAKDTIFESNGNVNSDTNLKNLLPSEAKLINNQNSLLNYIFQNLILGKKDKVLINNLSFISAVSNDNTGTLNVTYTIQNYWINNVPTTNIKSISVSLIGFVKETLPTEFKNTDQLAVTTDAELSKLSTNQLNKNKSLLQKFLLANEIIGNKDSIDFSNIIILNLTDENSSSGTITVNYQINKYWTNKGVSNVPKTFLIHLTDFKKVTLTPEQILQEINYSGTYEGLNVDKFLPIIQYLEFTNQSRLNSINDGDIHKKLVINPNFATLFVEIKDGNQADQTLSLNIFGTYKGVKIPDNQIINISGFYNSIDNYHEFSKFQSSIFISEMDFNLDSYFKNLQTEDDIKNWTSNDWITNYLSKMVISKYPADKDIISFNLLDYYQNKIFEDIQFNNVVESIASKSWKNFNINVNYANYKFNSTSKGWDKIAGGSSKTLNFKSASFLNFAVPTKNDAINWIASNATSFDVTKTSQYFASYWYSSYQKDELEGINSLVTIEDKYKLKYFDDTLALILDTMTINDLNGTMYISYKLDFNASQYKSSPCSISTTSFKKLSEFVDANKKESDNLIQVKVASTKSSLANNIIKSIKKDFTTDELKAFTKDNVVDMKSNPVLFRNNNEYRLFNGYNTNINEKLDENYLSTSISPMLFGKIVSRSTIDVDKNLFIYKRIGDNTSKFIINYISINVQSGSKATLTKVDNSKFIYKVPFKYVLTVESDSAQTIEIDSYYFAYLLNSDLGL